jgi:hypothetical protein
MELILFSVSVSQKEKEYQSKIKELLRDLDKIKEEK